MLCAEVTALAFVGAKCSGLLSADGAAKLVLWQALATKSIPLRSWTHSPDPAGPTSVTSLAYSPALGVLVSGDENGWVCECTHRT
jgi:hypothetical protein